MWYSTKALASRNLFSGSLGYFTEAYQEIVFFHLFKTLGNREGAGRGFYVTKYLAMLSLIW